MELIPVVGGTIDAGHFGDRERVERRSGKERRRGDRRRHADRRESGPGRGRAARSVTTKVVTQRELSAIDG